MNTSIQHSPAFTLRTPAFYQWLAEELITNQDQWAEFKERCMAVAGAQFYGHRSWQSVASAVLKGYSIGMDFVEALSKIQILEGRPTMRGADAVSHVHKMVEGASCVHVLNFAAYGAEHGERLEELVENWVEHSHPNEVDLDPTRIAVWVMQRPDYRPRVIAYTMNQAIDAGLPDRNARWSYYPDRCLTWQAAAIGVQHMFGDALGGMYLTEEIENSPPRGHDLEAPSSPRTRTAPIPVPAEELRREADPRSERDYERQLAEFRDTLEHFGISEDIAHHAVFGRALKKHLGPSYRELAELVAWLNPIEEARIQLNEGQTIHGYSLRMMIMQYDLHQALIERMSPKGKTVAWASAKRTDMWNAKLEATNAFTQVLLSQPWPDKGKSDEPDPEVVAAAQKAHDDEMARLKATGRPMSHGTADGEEYAKMMADIAGQIAGGSKNQAATEANNAEKAWAEDERSKDEKNAVLDETENGDGEE